MLTSELSVIMVTIAVGIQDRPPTAPQDGIWVSDYKLVEKPHSPKQFQQFLPLFMPTPVLLVSSVLC